MNNTREHIYLAALLHDIGKFYQRADTGSVASSEFLKTYCKDESSFCPLYKNNYSHKHVLWTAQFIEDNKAVFNNLVKGNLENLSNKDNLINLASCHHLKNEQLSDFGKIIKEADCLSSGMDRNSDEAYKDALNENSWDKFKKIRMIPIMQTINQQLNPDEYWRIPINGISLNKDGFPKKTFNNNPDYKTLWEKFNIDFKFVQANTYHAFSETLLNLLFKYTTCIPSSTINFPDVSLYDHLKTTAALAVCLYDVNESKGNPENPFLLIGGDFSGIQSYIYQIISKYAAKNLKGRSFYLHILSDAIVRFLLKELNLFQANVIYNSGGSFYIIAPNTSSLKDKLNKAMIKIEERLFKEHKTNIFVAIDYIELSKDSLMHKNSKENLSTKWDELFSKRDKKKSSKFASQIKNNYYLFFNPDSSINYKIKDSITGEDFYINEEVKKDDGLTLKPNTFAQKELGTVLREIDVMVVAEEEISYWRDKPYIVPANIGYYYYFLKSGEVNKMKEQLRASADKVSVITLNGKDNNCDFMGEIDGLNNIYNLTFYGGNKYNVKTYEEMCDNKGLSRLGVLRMDVDNLGSIFKSGIKPEHATLSRLAALSRSFDYFFSGYLNTIWKETNPDESFIVYSGGDDVFIVGSWDTTISIAKRIREDFREFSCNNPSFSISGGIAIVSAKYPIMKAAQQSAHEEDNAKRHKCRSYEKNSISFMEMPLNWDIEFPAVEKLKDTIVDLIKHDYLPKSFISKILAHHANAEIKNHKITVLKTFWMLTYDLSRMIDRIKENSAKQLINTCKSEICNNKKQNITLNQNNIETNYHILELWAFACRWAELEIRNDNY